jgi:hypothetical protein
MHYEFYNQLWDFDDDVELYFLHERILENAYLRILKAPKTEQRTDKATREFIRGMKHVWGKRAETGSIEWARPEVHNYDDSVFERVSNDYTMCWKKTNIVHDTLVIHLTSFAGHEGRLTNSLTNISPKIIDLDTDLLIVNEDPFRMPESLYPSYFILGCSSKCNSLSATADQIKTYIKKEYKNIVIYADSKHAGSGVSLAYELADLNPRVLVTGGITTYNWDTSPWVTMYLKWFNRPKNLEHQWISVSNIAVAHIIKCYKFKQMGIDERSLDPYKFLNDYNIPVDFCYGKYDSEYLSFKNHVSKLNLHNINMIEVDYKIADSQTHNIRPYVDRKILPEYIKNL